jgi:cardiolipin synthase
VRLVVDALYGRHQALGRTNPVLAELIDQPGIEVVASDPITLGTGLDTVALKQRDHRKLAIIDGAIAYVTGRNGADEYYLGWDEVAIDDATPHDAIPWLDAHARVRGPLVAELERVFAANWRRNGGGPLPATPPARAIGDVTARVITHDGVDDARAMAAYDALFAGARRRLIVVNDFPVIADLALRLIAAAQRGVAVDILTGNGVARRGDGTFFDGPRHRELFEYMVKRRYEALLGRRRAGRGVRRAAGAVDHRARRRDPPLRPRQAGGRRRRAGQRRHRQPRCHRQPLGARGQPGDRGPADRPRVDRAARRDAGERLPDRSRVGVLAARGATPRARQPAVAGSPVLVR